MSDLRVQHTNNRDKLINALADMDETFTKLNIAGLDLAHQAAMRFMSKNKSEVNNEKTLGWLDLATSGGAAAAMIAAGFQPEGAQKATLNALSQLSQGLGGASKTVYNSESTKYRGEQSEAREVQMNRAHELTREASAASNKVRQVASDLLQKMYK
jgi:hypothetical protein